MKEIQNYILTIYIYIHIHKAKQFKLKKTSTSGDIENVIVKILLKIW